MKFFYCSESATERRQAIILKRAICTCPGQNYGATSSTESLSHRHKCIAIHEPSPSPRNGKYVDASDARCVVTRYQKPLHIYSIIPFRKRATTSANKVKEKLDVRAAAGGRKLRQTSTSRPMSSNGDYQQPFDPFNLLGLERRTDGGQEISYGFLLVPAKASGGKNSVCIL